MLDDARKMSPVSCDNIDLVRDIADELGEHAGRNTIAKELRQILRTPHFQVGHSDATGLRLSQSLSHPPFPLL